LAQANDRRSWFVSVCEQNSVASINGFSLENIGYQWLKYLKLM
jgi:hypothetical protein